MSATDAAPRFTVGTLLDRTFELLLRHWPALLFVAVPITLTGYALPVMYASHDANWTDFVWSLPLLLVLHGLAVTLVTLIVARDIDHVAPPQTPPLTRAPAALGRFAVLQLLWVPMVALQGLLFIVPAVLFSVRSLFAANAVAAGRAGGWDAVRFSESLVRRRWWRTAAIMTMFLLPSTLLSWYFDYLPDTGWSHWLEALIDGLIYPIGLVGQAVLFFEMERQGPARPHDLHAAMTAARAQAASAASAIAANAPAVADPDAAFSAFEHRGWQRAAHVYHSSFGRLTSLAAGPLLDAAGVQLGQRVLDVACGPGYVSGIAASRGALVIGADFSPEMLSMAKEFHPEIEFRIADAEALPFENDSFDAVVTNFLLGHLPHPEKAISEARRVLKPGGRFAFSWWTGLDRALAFGLVIDAVRAHGRTEVALPPGPPFDQFADFETCAHALEREGFDDVRVAPQPLAWRVASADELWDAYYNGSVRTGGLLREQTPEALTAIRAAVTEGAQAFRRDAGLEFPMPCWIASGRKPWTGLPAAF